MSGSSTPLAAPPLLMTPGPTRIPERVLLAAHRVVHHRTAEFSEVIAEVLSELRHHFGTDDADILPVHATGRASMEASLLNLLAPDDEVVACCNGKFGQMWAGFARRHGFRVHSIVDDWDRSVTPDDVRAALRAAPSARAVLIVHSDTSTGVLNPVAEVATVAREHGALVFVDGISSVGGAHFSFADWGIDVAVTSSQKCLMSSPGLSFVALGERAVSSSSDSRPPPAYFDFGAIREALAGDRPETPGTTPVALMQQVCEALRAMAEGGDRGAQAERNVALADRVRSWAVERGFRLQGGPSLEERSPTLTALLPPDGVDSDGLRRGLLERGILVAGGLGPYRGRALRIGHMGDIRMADVERTLSALDDVLVTVGAAAR